MSQALDSARWTQHSLLQHNKWLCIDFDELAHTHGLLFQFFLDFLLDRIEIFGAYQYLVVNNWLLVGSLPKLKESFLVGHSEFVGL